MRAMWNAPRLSRTRRTSKTRTRALLVRRVRDNRRVRVIFQGGLHIAEMVLEEVRRNVVGDEILSHYRQKKLFCAAGGWNTREM